MQVSVEQLYEAALGFQAEGKLVDAERLYRNILAQDPTHAGATHHLGIIAMVTGHLEPAEALIRQSIALMPSFAPFHNTLAEVLRRAGRDDDAIGALKQAIAIDPQSAHFHSNIGVILSNARRLDESVPWLEKSIELAPEFAMAYFLLGQIQLELGRRDDAARSLQRLIELEPENQDARFLLAAATAQTPAQPPPGFVEQLFDSHASNFDAHVHSLGYRVPELLRAAVDRIRPDDKLDVLDLGCGTGLVARQFRDRAKTLAGVDVSKQMLEQARQTGLYETIECADLLAAMESRERKLDLILAGDVFIYVGELDRIFVTARKALRVGGLFAFSVETHDADGLTLRPSRRYAHSTGYIEKLAVENGFDIASSEPAALRRERNDDVAGAIYVLRVTA